MSFRIMAFAPDREPEAVALSLGAWAPVFAELEPVVPTYVYEAFYPDGWCPRQEADVREFLRAEGGRAWVEVATGPVVGWVGARLHPEDRMGEIHILAVDPVWQRRGVGRALMGHVMMEMRRAGVEIVMVETGDDPGHAPARAAYERAGFERWPVARCFRQL